MPLRAICALLAAASLWCAATAAAAAPQLQVVGQRLVDAATGQAFVARGANWASFEYACIYGYGYSDSADGGSVNPDAAGAAVIAGWHVNTVRVPLNEACWLGVDGQPKFGTAAGYRDAVRAWVSTLHAAGMAVILDLHWLAPAGVLAEGQRAMPDARATDFWASVATAFKDDRAVMFDVFNEPYSRFADDGTPVFDLTWPCWRDGGCSAPRVNDQQAPDGTTYTTVGMTQLVAAVRGTGARQPILLGGRDYANDLGEWLQRRPADDQLVASFHNYKAQQCHTTACWDSTIAPIAAQVPVITGEFGQDDCRDDHIKAYMDWADARGIGYLMWGWWVLADKTCGALALLADQQGTPRAPNGTALKAHLDALAAQQPGSPAGPGGAASGAPAPATGPAGSSALGLGIAGRPVQHLGRRLFFRLLCAVQCEARVTGRLVATPRRRAGRRVRRTVVRLERVGFLLEAGKARTLSLVLSRKARRAAARTLRRRGTATVTLTVRATDAAGAASVTTRRIRLVR